MQQIEAEGKTSRRHSRLIVGAAAATVAGVAALGVVAVGGDGDGSGPPASRDESEAPTDGLVELVTAPHDVVTAVQDERNTAVMELTGMADMVELPVAGGAAARRRTDEAVAGFQALVDAHPAGSAYQPALDDLDGLAALRGDVDADDGPRSITNLGPANEVFDRYAQVLTGLFDAQAAFVATIDDPELRDGAEVYQLVLRQQELTAALGRHAMVAQLRSGEAEVAELSRLHELVRQGGDTLVAAADGTRYEEVTTAAVGELDASGLLPAVAGLLEGGTVDIPDLLDAMASVSVEWRAAVDDVERGLTAAG